MNTSHLILYYIIPILLVLGILIFVHELGHFIMAKLCDVKVLRFSLGFGPKLISKQIGETEYAISMIPLGGYVKMLGEDIGEEIDENESISPIDKYRAFNKQPPSTRIGIVLAGPLFNILLALIIFILFYAIKGERVLVPEIGHVKRHSPAEKEGLEPGDIILALDRTPIKRWRDIEDIVRKRGTGVIMEMYILRKGEIFKLWIIPEMGKIKNIFGEEIEAPILGIVASGKTKILKFTFLEAIKEGFRKTCEMIKLTYLTIIKLIEGVVPIKTLGGPILIGQITGKIAQENWIYLAPFTAVISINLAVLNLMPVPILDGGLILLLLIELIIRRPLNQKFQEAVHKIGLVLLIGLMAMVMYNDIIRILTKR